MKDVTDNKKQQRKTKQKNYPLMRMKDVISYDFDTNLTFKLTLKLM